MVDQPVAWPRPYFKASEQQTKLLFVCFGKAPLAELELDRARFGVPTPRRPAPLAHARPVQVRAAGRRPATSAR